MENESANLTLKNAGSIYCFAFIIISSTRKRFNLLNTFLLLILHGRLFCCSFILLFSSVHVGIGK